LGLLQKLLNKLGPVENAIENTLGLLKNVEQIIVCVGKGIQKRLVYKKKCYNGFGSVEPIIEETGPVKQLLVC
jgi:hypothetical protein